MQMMGDPSQKIFTRILKPMKRSLWRISLTYCEIITYMCIVVISAKLFRDHSLVISITVNDIS